MSKSNVYLELNLMIKIYSNIILYSELLNYLLIVCAWLIINNLQQSTSLKQNC